MKSTNEIYFDLIQRLMQEKTMVSPRGMKTKEILCEKVIIDNPRDRIITLPYFSTSVRYAIGEFIWYLKATNKISEINFYSTVWKRFSDDGKTVNSAYGHRIFGKHKSLKVNQWEWVKNKLVEDPDSRQAVININLPLDKYKPTKDFPCTLALQFLLRKNRLNLIAYMRSNDINWGFRNDMFCFSMFQELMTLQLAEAFGKKIRLGKYYHVDGSVHIYERDFKKARMLLQEVKKVQKSKPMKKMTLVNIDKLIEAEKYIQRNNKLPQNVKDLGDYWVSLLQRCIKRDRKK